MHSLEVITAPVVVAHGKDEVFHTVHHAGLKYVFQELVINHGSSGFHL